MWIRNPAYKNRTPPPPYLPTNVKSETEMMQNPLDTCEEVKPTGWHTVRPVHGRRVPDGRRPRRTAGDCSAVVGQSVNKFR
jgi:hypothetical protein